MKIAGFSKIKSLLPNSNTMIWNSTANNVAYSGCGVEGGVAQSCKFKNSFCKGVSFVCLILSC
ncbi:MAG: hypothetical protein EAZ15_08295 [Sphingobacteriales bacterium]|nr:MAG: hypothetical protein EAZ15_08295 [Sphingobacteriales bacterium]